MTRTLALTSGLIGAGLTIFIYWSGGGDFERTEVLGWAVTLAAIIGIVTGVVVWFIANEASKP